VQQVNYKPYTLLLFSFLIFVNSGIFSDGTPSSYPHGTLFIIINHLFLTKALQPLRTVMNYQYRYGTTTIQAIHTLYADGGWTRYYQGLTAALVQGPVSRFGDTAANAGILALLRSNPYMKKLPTLIQTVFASLAAAAFRMILTPVDTVKTTLQTQGSSGMAILRARVNY
jgi:hypothetical protein